MARSTAIRRRAAAPFNLRREPHRMRRRQRMADFAPAIALVLGQVEAAGGRREGEPVAALVDRHRMAVDDVVGMALRQAFAQDVERLAAVAGAGDDELAVDRDAASSLIAGANQAVSGSRGWTATAKPKDDGGTSTISRQFAEPSSLRKMPL